jgi:hypothetical protein
MTRLLVLAVLLALVPTAGAAGVRGVAAQAPVVAIAMDGRRIAFAEGRSAGDCDRVRIWNLQTRAVTKLGRSTHCEQTSTGNGIASLAIAEGRVLWLHYAGGNIREWSLFTATVTAPRPRRLRFVARDVDLPSPIVVGDGNGSRFGDLLPYAVERDVVALRPDGSRRFSWRAPGLVVALSAQFNELAVATQGGLVTVLDAAGRPARTELFDGEVSAVKLSRGGVLAQLGRTFELRRGGTTRSFTVPRGARLEDALGDRAFYAVGQQTRELLLTTGADRLVATGSHIEAELSTVAVSAGRSVTARPLG